MTRLTGANFVFLHMVAPLKGSDFKNIDYCRVGQKSSRFLYKKHRIPSRWLENSNRSLYTVRTTNIGGCRVDQKIVISLYIQKTQNVVVLAQI